MAILFLNMHYQLNKPSPEDKKLEFSKEIKEFGPLRGFENVHVETST